MSIYHGLLGCIALLYYVLIKVENRSKVMYLFIDLIQI